MAELHSSGPWRKRTQGSTYAGVFGGPAKYTARFSPRIEDYPEIFGGAASASAITVLELPPAEDGFEPAGSCASACNCRAGVDYPEIFGVFGGGGFPVSCEDLFVEAKISGFSSSDVKIPENNQQANDASEVHLDGYTDDHVKKLIKDQILSVPMKQDDVSLKQFNMSYNKISLGTVGDIRERTQTTQLDAISEFTVVVDPSNPIRERKSKDVTEDITRNSNTNGFLPDDEKEKEARSISSSCVKNSKMNQKAHLKPSESDYASIVPGNEKHHSHSLSCHATTGGDISVTDVAYLKISEISLQTKPLQCPPPSREPPKVVNKAQHQKLMWADYSTNLEEGSILESRRMYQLYSNTDDAKGHTIDKAIKDNSGFYDAEMHPGSAAAASEAVIKEAMERAQARLKCAKDFMERKPEKFHRKASKNEAKNNNTRQEEGIAYDGEPKVRFEVRAAKNLLEENNPINECTLQKRGEIHRAFHHMERINSS